MFQFIEIQTAEEGYLSVRKSDKEGRLWTYSGMPSPEIDILQLLQYEINVMNNNPQNELDPLPDLYQLSSITKIQYIRNVLSKATQDYHVKAESETINFNQIRIREIIYFSTGVITIKVESLDSIDFKPLNELNIYNCHWNPWVNSFEYPQNPIRRNEDTYEIDINFEYVLVLEPNSLEITS